MERVHTPEFHQELQRLEFLVRETDQSSDPTVRERITTIVRGLLDLHAAGFERVLNVISDADEPGKAILENLIRDELVRNLLLLHGLHPDPFEARVRQAVDKLRPLLGVQGIAVELLDASDQRIRLRVQRDADAGSHLSPQLRETIEQGIHEAAPDLAGLEIEGLEDLVAMPAVSFVPLDQVRSGTRRTKQETGVTAPP